MKKFPFLLYYIFKISVIFFCDIIFFIFFILYKTNTINTTNYSENNGISIKQYKYLQNILLIFNKNI